MPIRAGKTSGSITTTPFAVPCTIRRMSVVNQSGGAITVNIFINVGGVAVNIWSSAFSIAAGAMLDIYENIKLSSGSTLAIVTSGAIDYYISFE